MIRIKCFEYFSQFLDSSRDLNSVTTSLPLWEGLGVGLFTSHAHPSVGMESQYYSG